MAHHEFNITEEIMGILGTCIGFYFARNGD
jgi:hypothetical protein